jgi:hypothetical protein
MAERCFAAQSAGVLTRISVAEYFDVPLQAPDAMLSVRKEV